MIKGKNVASPLLSRLACGSIAAFTFARLFLSLLIVSCAKTFLHTRLSTRDSYVEEKWFYTR